MHNTLLIVSKNITQTKTQTTKKVNHMSNIFAGKTKADNEVEEDFMGGGGILDTDLYTATIKAVYLGKSSSSEAQSVNFLLDIAGKELRSSIWVSNKKGEITYKDKNSGDLKNLPGYNQVDSVAMLIAGKELSTLDVEERTLKLYDFDAKKELPKAVQCFVELHGETVSVAVQRQTVDKTKKDDSGAYQPTGETRDENEVIKFFDPDKQATISEVSEYIKSLGGNFTEVLNAGEMGKALSTMPTEHAGVYAAKWLERNKGNIYNKATGKAAGGGKAFGGSTGGGDAPKAATNLFG